MKVLIDTILANFLISLGSLAGVVTLAVSDKKLERWLLALVSLSAGVLMGAAFFHLLAETSSRLSSDQMYLMVFLAFSGFFLIEKLLHWHHCHRGKTHRHTLGYLNLIGDGIHNFIDGVIITAGLLAGKELGLITILAVALHEIPQEISDFGVLLYSGFSKSKALLYNLLTGFTAILGGILAYFLSFAIDNLFVYLLPFAAGGFLYIAASDLMPEIRKEASLKKSLINFVIFLGGIALMYFAKTFEG